MKEHVSYSPTGAVACRRSGRSGQSKGVVFGLPPARFANVPEENRCTRCAKIFNRH